MKFNVPYFLKMFKVMSRGFKNTMVLSMESLFFAILLGFLLAIVRYYKVPVMAQLSVLFTSFFRSTPFIAQLFVFYYGLAQVSESIRKMSGYNAVLIVLSLSFAAYMGETFRAAILSVDYGQYEAGLSIGLSTWQTIRRVMIPQAFRVALPGMANTFANLFKSTSLAFTVGVMDLTSCAKNEVNLTYKYMEGYTAMLVIYWVILAVFDWGQSRLEKKMNVPYKQGE